jgi:hypothetical protein
LQQCRLAASERGARVFRNNTGKLQDKTGRWVDFGLCVGSSDLIGLTQDGRFLAIEVKRPGEKATQAQERFIEMVNSMGGVAFVATSAKDVYDRL